MIPGNQTKTGRHQRRPQVKSSALLGVVFAVLASTNLNVGKGMQKWKVRIFGHGKDMFAPEHRRDLLLWVCGFLLTFSATPLYSLALLYTEKSSTVSALNGVGMIGLVIFAWLVLRERIGAQEIGGAVLVLAGVTVMGYFDQPLEGAQRFALAPFLCCVLVTSAVFVPLALYAWKTNHLYGFTFGAIPGILIGIAMILGDMALVESGNSMLGQFSNPYPYLAVAVGAVALVVTQLAFWRARAMVVVPTINSFIILTPVIYEIFTFDTRLAPVQWGAVGAIVLGVILLTATAKQDRIEGKAQPGREVSTPACRERNP